jgi:hypothetical protein
MSGIILTLLFLAGLAVCAWIIHTPDKADEENPDERRRASARESPASTASAPALHPVSERQIERESRKLIDEIERYLSDHQAS